MQKVFNFAQIENLRHSDDAWSRSVSGLGRKVAEVFAPERWKLMGPYLGGYAGGYFFPGSLLNNLIISSSQNKFNGGFHIIMRAMFLISRRVTMWTITFKHICTHTDTHTLIQAPTHTNTPTTTHTHTHTSHTPGELAKHAVSEGGPFSTGLI